jgi:hypothetical protein
MQIRGRSMEKKRKEGKIFLDCCAGSFSAPTPQQIEQVEEAKWALLLPHVPPGI